MIWRLCLIGIASASFLMPCHAQQAKDAVTFKKNVAPFLNSYCGKCHSAKQQKGDRRFDLLDGSIAGDNSLVDYQDVLDQLNLGEMPPADSKQPSDVNRKKIIRWLTKRIEQYHASSKSHGSTTVLRRLNSREYRNTIGDLLHLNIQLFDPAETFPKDDTHEHLDNVGDTLVTSGHLLARYLEAADVAIGKAMSPITKPKVQTWKFRDGFKQQPEIDQVHRKTNKYNHMTLYDVIGADKHEGAYGAIYQFAKGVPSDGIYEIKFKAEALNRLHPYDDDFLGRDRNEPLRLGIRPGDQTVGKLHLPQPIEPLLAEIELADKQKWYTVKVWLDQGYTPRFTFRNGLMDARNLWSKVIKKYRDQFPKDISKGIVAQRFNAIKHGKLPQIHIHEIEIRGPIFDKWPTNSHQVLLGKDCENILATGKLTDAQTEQLVTRFANRAYRRPASDQEIKRIVDLIRHRHRNGRSHLDAFADGLKAILCSPNFLYLDEGDKGTLSPYALASRLSYFLWSAPPDDRLFSLAKNSKLKNEAVLMAEVDRMLADPKSDALVDGFLDSWLTLRDLGSAPPERGSFRAFYQYDLGTAMRQETRLFVRHLIDHDKSLLNFIDSNFTFANKPLAKMYGFDVPKGNGFELVRFDDKRRGGLLGQASVLTVTANGIDTSPVVRGVWMLENFLGTPPSPPPPDIEPLDPDIRGAKTIRDQLSKHRTVASCNECHRKIDPLGFALENFDPVGRWRNSYGRKTQIDASGKLPNGKQFDDIVDLKRILMQQKELFAKALAQKLLAYAIGRPTTPSDRPQIDQILAKVQESDWGMKELIKQVVVSKPFLVK